MQSTTPKKPRRLNLFRSGQFYLVPSLVLGVAAIVVALILRSPTDEHQKKVAIDTNLVLIDVPSRNVQKGEQIKNIPFVKIKWPSSVSTDRFVQDGSSYLEYYSSIDLPAYTPVPKHVLISSSSDVNAVVENIPPGYRAITVKVDVESVVEGWAQTGNFVDVIVLRQSADPDLGIEAKLIAENVKILAAGATVELKSDSPTAAHAPPTVTLLVSQEDALKIRTAATVGKLTFALRGVGDKSPSTTLAMNQKLLLGGVKGVALGKSEKKGIAKGPDGKTYILDGNSEWIRQIGAEQDRRDLTQ